MFAPHHVQLAMPRGEEDRARAFYAGVLAMEELTKPPALAERGGAWFRAGALELHLGVEDDFSPARKAHPGVVTDALHVVADRLRAAGHEPRFDGHFPGFDRFYVDDCFGNRLEFLQATADDAVPGPARQVRTFHRLAGLTEAEIVAVDDATAVDVPTPGAPSPVDLLLPEEADDEGSVTLVDALARRRTRRETPVEPLSAERLGWLLGHTARVTADGRRPHPSAGAGYPLRLDVVALRCEGVTSGVYRYEPDVHGLRTVATGDRAEAVGLAFGRDWTRRARIVIAVTADLAEATHHHRIRGYRYALLEAGHLAQNLLLLAAAVDLPACPVGGFADETLGELLDVAHNEVVLYAVVL